MKPIAILALCLLTCPLHAQTLWQGLPYGMPKAELVKRNPGLREMTREEVASSYPEELRTAAGADLVGSTQLFDHPFVVRFSLAADKLTRVALTLTTDRLERGKADATRDAVLDALKEKYGAAASFRTDEKYGPRNPGFVGTWKAGSTTIRCHSVVIDDHLFLAITYTVESTTDRDRL